MVFRGTQVPHERCWTTVRDGDTLKECLDFFPSVRREDADEFLRLAVEGTSCSCWADRVVVRKKHSSLLLLSGLGVCPRIAL